jgi:hypothetical protein
VTVPPAGDTLPAWYGLPSAGPIVAAQTAADPQSHLQRGGPQHFIGEHDFARKMYDSSQCFANGRSCGSAFALAQAGTAAGFEYEVLCGERR